MEQIHSTFTIEFRNTQGKCNAFIKIKAKKKGNHKHTHTHIHTYKRKKRNETYAKAITKMQHRTRRTCEEHQAKQKTIQNKVTAIKVDGKFTLTKNQTKKKMKCPYVEQWIRRQAEKSTNELKSKNKILKQK